MIYGILLPHILEVFKLSQVNLFFCNNYNKFSVYTPKSLPINFQGINFGLSKLFFFFCSLKLLLYFFFLHWRNGKLPILRKKRSILLELLKSCKTFLEWNKKYRKKKEIWIFFQGFSKGILLIVIVGTKEEHGKQKDNLRKIK